MLPIAPCLLKTMHGPHDWAYTSWGGGHMVRIGDTDEKGYKEWHCIGLDYLPRHRGYAQRRWITPYTPKHRGTYRPEYWRA